MQFKTFYWLSHWYISQYTIISKYGERTRQLKFKFFLKKTMAASENRFAPELNEKEDIELLENATPGSIKKPTKINYGMKIFQGKNFKTLF